MLRDCLNVGSLIEFKIFFYIFLCKLSSRTVRKEFSGFTWISSNSPDLTNLTTLFWVKIPPKLLAAPLAYNGGGQRPLSRLGRWGFPIFPVLTEKASCMHDTYTGTYPELFRRTEIFSRGWDFFLKQP